MGAPKGFKAADLGGDVQYIVNRNDGPIFKEVSLHWKDPVEWDGVGCPPGAEARACLYVLLRDHGNQAQSMVISYIGISENPRRRFYNHPSARELSEMSGKTCVSFCYLKADDIAISSVPVKVALEQIEHILIWTLWNSKLWNNRKIFTLPGFDAHGATPWHIENMGYDFLGQMPKEIIYPWILVKNRRDRSWKE